jgi:hypothetical protein
MFCAECGKEVKEDAKFCGSCGWAVPAVPDAARGTPPAYPSRPWAVPPDAPAAGPAINKKVLAAILAVAAAIAIVAVVMLQGIRSKNASGSGASGPDSALSAAPAPNASAFTAEEPVFFSGSIAYEGSVNNGTIPVRMELTFSGGELVKGYAAYTNYSGQEGYRPMRLEYKLEGASLFLFEYGDTGTYNKTYYELFSYDPGQTALSGQFVNEQTSRVFDVSLAKSITPLWY